MEEVVLRIRTPPSDEVMEERYRRRKQVCFTYLCLERYLDILIAFFASFILTALWINIARLYS